MEFALHICCVVCLIYPLEVLKQKGFKIKGFFYNPNIQPFSEYRRRKEALDNFSRNMDVEIFYPEYSPQDFFRKINLNEEKPQRCILCWRLRLENTVNFALEHKIEYFSTTLLVSPYQDHYILKKLGEQISQDKKVKFYYEDFRDGFKESYQKAKHNGLYCQNYCGCIYSEVERWQRLEKH